MSGSLNDENVTFEPIPFEEEVQWKADQFLSGQIPFAAMRKWMIEQEWPSYDPETKTCEIASICWWYIDLVDRGNDSDGYKMDVQQLLTRSLYGWPIQERTIDPSKELRASTYARLQSASRRERS